MEGAHFKKTGKLVELSEQNLVDCVPGQVPGSKCNPGGGLMTLAFDYVISNNGIDTEASYEYTGADESCMFSNKSIGATMSLNVDVETGSEASLQSAVAKIGPVSVAIDASSWSFQLYHSGVYFDSQCGNGPRDLNHGVTAVGYGNEWISGFPRDYWIIKNSWGTNWGDAGYIKMARNHNNMCGVATDANYVVA